MAENTTTYKAVIDTEVKGKEEVEGLGDEADKTGGKFKSLKAQIRETTVELQKLEDQGKTNTKEFENLKNKLDDLQDAQDRVNFKSKQFGDQIAALPGPIGQLGGGLKSAQDAVATFGKSITVALGIVGLIVAAFMAMKEALGKTAEGQEAMKKVTDALSKVMAPFFALLSKVGIPIFEAMANIIGKVAEGFEWAAKKLGLTTAEVKKFDQAATDAQKNLADQQQKELEDMAKVIAYKKQLDEKAAADKKARREKELREQAEREAEALREEQLMLEGIIKEFEKRKKDRAKLDFKVLKQETLQDQINKNLEQEAREKEFEEKIKNLKINSLDEQNATLKKLGTPVVIQELQKKEDAVKASLAAEKKFVELTEADKLSIISDGLGAVAALVGENTIAGKALAVAQATIDTYAGANKALSTYPPPFGAIAAGTVIVAGLLNVKKILSTQIPKIPGARGGATSSNISAPSIPTVPTITAPQVNTTGGQNPTAQIAETINQAQKPIKAYVVSGDVTSQQALDRRTSVAATFG